MDLKELSLSLVKAEDPLQVIFSSLNKIWTPEGGLPEGKIDGFYSGQERETNRLEAYVRDIYFEVYDLLLRRIRDSHPVDRLEAEDGQIILMDGFSIREANLLIPRLRAQGCEIVDYTYGLSQIPSDTQVFLKQVFGTASLSTTKKWKDFEVVYVHSGEVPAFLPESGKAIVWLSFPDELLHHTRGEVITPKETVRKTEETLLKVLTGLNSERAVITSDHGYIYAKSAALFWKAHRNDERVLKRVFKAGRGLLLSEVTSDLERLRQLHRDRSYVIFDEQGCYVRGRFYWGVSGRQSDVAHGGLSFMECLVPVLKIQRV